MTDFNELIDEIYNEYQERVEHVERDFFYSAWQDDDNDPAYYGPEPQAVSVYEVF